MDLKVKIFLTATPFFMAGYTGFMVLQPTLDEYNMKQSTVSTKKEEAEQLNARLGSLGNIGKTVKDLDRQISSLRQAVPKSPDLEILNLDLERMAEAAGIDIIKFEPTVAAAGTTSSSVADETGERSSVMKGAGANALKKRIDKVTGAKDKKDDKKDKEQNTAADPGLSERNMTLTLMGSYESLVKMLNSIETYQRVLKVESLKAWVPKKIKPGELPDEGEPGAEEELDNPDLLVITVGLKTYYLP